jgi:ABC-type antimicrobial peptide transport system, ATPase component
VTDITAMLDAATVRYSTAHGSVTALREVTVSFPAGSASAIVGRSGSGKSTLISVLSLLRRPTSGRVLLRDVVVSELSERELARARASVGIVFQSFHLEPSLTAAENVMLPWYFGISAEAGRRRMSRRTAYRRAVDILERLGIGALAGRRPNAMSGGQRQRVAIARALFTNPILFVADEPTGNLDEETANDVAATIFGLPATFGTTVVVVTHDAEVAAMADTRLELVRGELVRTS